MQALEVALGAPHPDPQAFWGLKRGGATTRRALVSLGMDEGHAETVSVRWLEAVESDRMLRVDTVLPGIEDALVAARRHAERLVVVTARRRGAAARAQCERLGLMAIVDDVIAVDPADAPAAKAEVLRRIKALGFIGDTASDARAAVQAGVPFAAVTTGQHTREVLAAAIDAPIVATLAEAVAVLTHGYRSRT